MKFRTYLLCHYLTNFGAWLSLIALISQLAIDYTSGLPVALALVAKRFPTALAYPFGGLFANRLGHSQTIKGINLISGLLLSLLALHCWTNPININFLLLIYIGLSVLDGLSKPVSRAFLASFTSCPATISRFNMALNIISVLGMLSASISVALLNGNFNTGTIVFANALFCLISWVLLQSSKNTQVIHTDVSISKLSRFAHIAIPYSVAINCTYGLLMLIISQYPSRIFSSSPSLSGILYTCAAISALAGAVIYHQMYKEVSCPLVRQILACIAFIGMTVAFSGLCISPDIHIAALMLGLCLIPFYYLKQHVETLLLLNCPIADHGPTISFLYIAEEVFIAIGIICGTLMLDIYGEFGILSSGAFFILIALGLMLVQHRKHLIFTVQKYHKRLI